MATSSKTLAREILARIAAIAVGFKVASLQVRREKPDSGWIDSDERLSLAGLCHTHARYSDFPKKLSTGSKTGLRILDIGHFDFW